MTRLTPEREGWVREFVESWAGEAHYSAPLKALGELLSEIDALRIDLDAAEQKGRGQCGNFVNQGDGTAKCAACGFCVRGAVRTMRYVEP